MSELRVGARAGATVKIGGADSFEFFRIDVSIEGIDPDRADEQLADANPTIEKVREQVVAQMDMELESALGKRFMNIDVME